MSKQQYQYTSVEDPSKVKMNKKPPSFLTEAAFISSSLFLLKFYSDAAFDALSFTTVLLPLMVYFIGCLILNVVKFI